MERKIIPDSQISSSSGILNENGTWCTANPSLSYLEVDLLQKMSITGVRIKDDGVSQTSVTKFKLQYSFNGLYFDYIYTDGLERVSSLNVISYMLFLRVC